MKNRCPIFWFILFGLAIPFILNVNLKRLFEVIIEVSLFCRLFSKSLVTVSYFVLVPNIAELFQPIAPMAIVNFLLNRFKKKFAPNKKA